MTKEPGKSQEIDHLQATELQPSSRAGRTGYATVSDVLSAPIEGGFGDPIGEARRDPLKMLLAALLRFKWSVLAVSVVLSTVAVVVIWKFVVPEYSANAVVRVSPVGTTIVFRTEENGMMPLYQSFLNTQVTIIRGPTVLERVLDDPKVRLTAWYQNSARPLIGSPPTTIERLLKDLGVAPRALTELIDVKMNSPSAEDAKLIADTVVDTYQTYSNELINETELVRLETLLQEKNALEREIDGLVATKSHLTAQIGAADPIERLTQASQRLATLEVERDLFDRKLAQARWEISVLPVSDNADTKDGASAAPHAETLEASYPDGEDGGAVDYAQDSEWRTLKSSLTMTQYELEQGRQRFGPLHPQIAELEQRVTQAQVLLGERVAQLDEQSKLRPIPATDIDGSLRFVPNVAAMHKEVSRFTNEIALLDATIDRARAKVKEFGQLMKDLTRYDEELLHKRETYDLLRTRVEQLALERKAPARITVAGYAVKPTAPSRDRRVLLTVMALLGSLGLGIGVSYLRLMMDATVRDRGDVQIPSAVRFFGHLPVLPEANTLLSSCTPAAVESMRIVRTALLERVQPSKNAAILVTSSSTHAGKTTVSILLANSLASLGKRILLVEADLRRPSIASRLCLDPRPGLAMVLTGEVVDSDVIQSPPAFKFDILPAGLTPEGFSPDILADSMMTSAIHRWKQNYDFVLLDSPPAPPVADARILGGMCDGTIMVVRYSHCRRGEVAEAYGSLALAGCNVIGTILIGSAGPGSSYNRYGDYYYGYGADNRMHLQLGTDDRMK